ncbi:MAG: PKD domain-containing protein [Candidatus Bipolaricaulia bacterium]
MISRRANGARAWTWLLGLAAVGVWVALGSVSGLAQGQQTQPAQIEVGSVELAPDEAGNVPVELTGSPAGGVVSYQGEIPFDPNVIEIVEVRFNENCPVFAFNVQNGTLQFAATKCDGEGLTSGPLMRIRVRAVGSPGDTQEINPSFSIFHDADFESIPTEVSPGTITIVGGNEKPTVDFETNPDPPVANEPTEFVDRSEDPDGEIVEWEWDFGDGATSTEQNPTHTYKETGTFTVTLTVTDDGGATATAEREITVEEEPISRPTLIVFPNPASGDATFGYRLPSGTTSAQLIVYNLEGRLILEASLDTDRREFVWDLRANNGRDAPNGPYFAFVRAMTPDGAKRSDVEVLIIQR